jgi:hypothetical protein
MAPSGQQGFALSEFLGAISDTERPGAGRTETV